MHPIIIPLSSRQSQSRAIERAQSPVPTDPVTPATIQHLSEIVQSSKLPVNCPNLTLDSVDWAPQVWVPPLTRAPRARDLGHPHRKSGHPNSRRAVGSRCFLTPPPSQLPVPMVGESRQAAPDSRVKKALSRQSRSCKVCRARKVKVRETNRRGAQIADGRDRPGPLPCFTDALQSSKGFQGSPAP